MGDLLQFEYDSNIGKLTATKNNSENYEMDVEKSKTEKYAVCVYLVNNDSV